MKSSIHHLCLVFSIHFHFWVVLTNTLVVDHNSNNDNYIKKRDDYNDDHDSKMNDNDNNNYNNDDVDDRSKLKLCMIQRLGSPLRH